jgi:flagellar motor switch protein FliG
MQITGVERAAVLMMLVGEDEAAAILQKLDPDEVQALGRAMFAVADVGESEVIEVLGDFVSRAKARTGIGFDPKPQIETMMTRALGADRADSVLSRIMPREEACDIEPLGWMDTAEIADIVTREHPQIGTVLIANLDPQLAGQVLQLLPEPAQADLMHRLAKLGPVSPDAIETLKNVLGRHKATRRAPSSLELGGTKEAAAIINNSNKATEQRVIARLNKLDKELARAIEEQMFVFENLLALDDKTLGTLLRSVDADILTVALKGLDEAGRSKFLGCMSSRAADGIRDEMEARGPMKMADVLEAQKAILIIARDLAKAGTINLGGKDDDYV